MKTNLLTYLICLTASTLLAQTSYLDGQNMVSDTFQDQENSTSTAISDDDVILEAAYKSVENSMGLDVYPHVIKQAQQFVLHLEHLITTPFEIHVKDSNGDIIETIFNSQLSVFKPNQDITLNIYTPLDSGMYFVVVDSEEYNGGVRLMKFGESYTPTSTDED